MNQNKIVDSNLHELTISQYLNLFKLNKLQPIDLINHLIKRVKKYEKYLKSMAVFSPEDILNQIDIISKKSRSKNGFLNGAAIGIKDVYNTINFKTSYGSQIYKNFKAGNNARIVDNIIDNNGIIFCKTKTAEFSVHHPPDTVNPYSKNHIAGTSSTGSAVAVSTGLIQSALGTQTAGSTFRPASYNGIYGYKPSFGIFPRTGILKTTDTLDHPTVLSRSINDIEILFNYLKVNGPNYPFVNKNLVEKKYSKKTPIYFFKGYTWKNLDDYTKNQFFNYLEKVQKKLKINIKELTLDNNFTKIHTSHEIIYNKSLSYYFKKEYSNNYNKLSTSLIDMIDRGNKINLTKYKKELKRQEEMQFQINQLIKSSIILSPCTAGEAPKKNDVEKDDLSLFWTYMNTPCVSVPCLKGINKLPMSIIVSSGKFDDILLFDFIKLLKRESLIKDSKVKDPHVI